MSRNSSRDRCLWQGIRIGEWEVQNLLAYLAIHRWRQINIFLLLLLLYIITFLAWTVITSFWHSFESECVCALLRVTPSLRRTSMIDRPRTLHAIRRCPRHFLSLSLSLPPTPSLCIGRRMIGDMRSLFTLLSLLIFHLSSIAVSDMLISLEEVHETLTSSIVFKNAEEKERVIHQVFNVIALFFGAYLSNENMRRKFEAGQINEWEFKSKLNTHRTTIWRWIAVAWIPLWHWTDFVE